ncbi:hypothetical protein ACFYNL_26355 [Streptomyces sp. NPDC007808]|uniref:hypothetical protein n=1 Tax=Streptomyces sp. NPDC007808 TaxID=3364779 RepID=UPI00368FD70C
MPSKRLVRVRSAAVTAALAAAVVTTVLAPGASAAHAAPLPLPAGTESLVTEGVTIEGPLINNVTLPTLH